MEHYDVFSWFYEYGTEKLHGGHRLEAIELLRLQPGDRVLDVPTGTGANLPHLIERIGPTGEVCAIDYSKGMLAKARSKVRDAGWTNVTLIEADARRIDAQMVGENQFDAAICILGLSVVPDWAEVFERMFAQVRPGGRVAVMDLYLNGKRSSGAANTYYKVLAKADQRRRFWEPLEQHVDDLETIDHNWWGGVARVVGGTKGPETTIDLTKTAAEVDVSEPAAPVASSQDQPANEPT
jgi:demethylmenaquinone methyltransferase/2-methoxy-6-polyprenyl-1,4-benzoquinol methylase